MCFLWLRRAEKRGKEEIKTMLNGVRIVLVSLIVLFNGGIVFLLTEGMTGSPWWGLFWTVAIVGGLFALGVSELGEKYWRVVMRLRPPTEGEKMILLAAWREVCSAAGEDAAKFDLFIAPPAYPGELNAYAIGNRTVAATPDLLTLPIDEIKAVLAHELAHLRNGDTKYLLMVNVANAAGTVAVWVLTALAVVVAAVNTFMGHSVGTEEGRMVAGAGILVALFAWFLKACAWLCTKVFQIAFLGIGRAVELRCDEYAVRLGFGQGMLGYLERVWPFEGSPARSFTASLYATHPPVGVRMSKVQKIMQEMSA